MRELEQEIVATPDSDDPRMVYADWTEDIARGEFIAVQCALARELDLALVERERELLHAHGARWIAEYGVRPKLLPAIAFRRGFPEHVELDVDELATAQWDRMPLRSVVVCGVRHVVAIADRAAIPGVTRFGLRNAVLDASAWRTLANAPLVVGAEMLALHRGRFHEIASLLDLELPALRSLFLDDPNMRLVENLARARWAPQLRSLQIRDSQGLAIGRLLSAKTWRLRELRIETSLADSTLARLATAPVMETVEQLEVAIGFGDFQAVRAFAHAKALPALKRFVVRGEARDSDLERLRERWGRKLTVQREPTV